MINPMDLTGKRILYVSDGSGLDRTIAERLTELGAELTIYPGITTENAERELAAEATKFDGFVFGIEHSDFRPLQFVKPELVNSIMHDNFGMFVEVMRVLKKHKLLKDRASVVALSSISSIRAMKAKMAFSAAKAALDAAVRSLAVELSNKRIRVNSVQKGGVDTDMQKEHIQDITAINNNLTEQKQPLGLSRAEEIANVVAFLLSDATSTITGTSIIIDGGYTL